MTTMDMLRLGFCIEGDEPARINKRTDGEQLMLDVEFLALTDRELTAEYGKDWKAQYIAACKDAGVEPFNR